MSIELPSEDLLRVMLRALKSETENPATHRSKVSIKGKDRSLIIQMEANDTSALRATINSFLRLVVVVRDTYETSIHLENMQV
ncbi:MAG: hypothetical protein JSV51_06375 [Candidatus Bathyarchaeota archaeon]|nr:MAG: hypothetical protein JSV51_06375 [Candidatus Bathyarchaeota archaeon]